MCQFLYLPNTHLHTHTVSVELTLVVTHAHSQVKVIAGLGTTIDVILRNGILKEGDTLVLTGTEGPFTTQVTHTHPHPHTPSHTHTFTHTSTGESSPDAPAYERTES